MHWLLITIFAILSRAVYGLFSKVLSSKVKASPAIQSIIFLTFATVLSLIISPFIGGISFNDLAAASWTMLIMILSLSLGMNLYYIGIESLDSSIAQIAFSSILIWGTFLSIIFLNSNFSIFQFLGIIILLIALILIQLKNKTLKLSKGILFIVLSAGSFSIFQVSSAELAKTIPIGTYLFLSYLGSAILLGAIYAKNIKPELNKLKGVKTQTFWIMIFTAITNTMYAAFSYFAYKLAPDSGVVVLLLTSQVIVAVILSIVFLRERDHIRLKLAAGILALIAGILIKG